MKKKILSAVLAAMMLASVNVSATAIEVSDNAIYIESEAVPAAATAYARDIFAHLYVDEVVSTGFSYDEADNLKLASGFNAYSYDGTKSDNIYYYPVMNDNEVVALLTVTNFDDDEYNFSFGKNDMAIALNEIDTSSSNTAKIVVSDNAFYAVNDNSVTMLSSLHMASESEIDKEIATLSANNTTQLINLNSQTVAISGNIVYSETVQSTLMKSSDYSSLKTVPFVDNWSFRDENNALRGTCWASCAASLIEYYNNGSSSSNGRAGIIRDNILSMHYSNTGSYLGGSDSVVISFIEQMASGVSMTATNSTIPFDEILLAININDAPFYTVWTTSTGSAHAMVVCGYGYDSTDISNSTYHRIQVMDPNNADAEEYIIVGINKAHAINNKNYYWSRTVTKD